MAHPLRPVAAPVWTRRAPLTREEALADAVGTVQRLRWVLEATLERACPDAVDPRDAAAVHAWLRTVPPPPAEPDPAEELARILARGRAEAPPAVKAWVPCTGVVPDRRARWVELELAVPVRAVG
jgi:hypothetical protein